MADERESETTAPTTTSDGRAAPEVRDVLLLDTDLFFVVKIGDTLKHASYTTRTVRSVRDFVEALATHRPHVALVNTAARGVDFAQALAAARDAGVPTVAYGSHVDLATQQAARDAGATVVVANSRLAADLPGTIARALRRDPSDSANDGMRRAAPPGQDEQPPGSTSHPSPSDH